MKLFILTICLVIVCVIAKAQQAYPDNAQFSIGVNAGLPTGITHDSHTFVLGGYIQEAVPIGKALQVTINLGYNKFFGKNTFDSQSPNTPFISYPDIDMLAAKGGLKYYLLPAFYLQAEAGIALVLGSRQTFNDPARAFIYSPKIGYAIPAGAKRIVDISLRYEATNNFGAAFYGNVSALTIGVGYGF